jgi:ribosomal protein S4
MRFLNKYKKIATLDRFIYPQLALRVLKFRRPKWKKFQKQVLNSKKSTPVFINPFILKNSFKQWEKVKNYYKSGLQFKKKLMVWFDDAANIKIIKKQVLKNQKSNKDILLSTFLKSEFRVDILLWRLNFFPSSYSARQSLNEGSILLNGKPTLSNTLLKKGDILSFRLTKSPSSFSLKDTFSSIYTKQSFCSFVEVDFYTKTLVVIKDLNDLTLDDFSLIITEYFDLKKFRDYL